MIKRYYFKHSSAHSGRLYSIEKAILNDRFLIHDHDFHELVIVTRGQALHLIDGKAYSAQAGDVFVLAGELTHEFTEVHHLELYNIMFDSDKLREMPAQLLSMPGYHALFVLDSLQVRTHGYKSRMRIGSSQICQLQMLLDAMINESSAASAEVIVLLEAYFQILLIHLSRYYESFQDNDALRIKQMADALVYIEQHFSEPLVTRQLAKMTNLSVRHFSRLFYEVCHVPPSVYIIRKRLAQACHLLHDSDQTITDIAALCGFSDSNYFSRKFHQFYQMTPSLWRKTNRNHLF